jgi:hypothetical protein
VESVWLKDQGHEELRGWFVGEIEDQGLKTTIVQATLTPASAFPTLAGNTDELIQGITI